MVLIKSEVSAIIDHIYSSVYMPRAVMTLKAKLEQEQRTSVAKILLKIYYTLAKEGPLIAALVLSNILGDFGYC